jgi:hypothetical protein
MTSNGNMKLNSWNDGIKRLLSDKFHLLTASLALGGKYSIRRTKRKFLYTWKWIGKEKTSNFENSDTNFGRLQNSIVYKFLAGNFAHILKYLTIFGRGILYTYQPKSRFQNDFFGIFRVALKFIFSAN